MSKLTDRISFLKGMAAGMKLNMDKDANKLMLEMLTVMGEMAEEMAAMTEAHNDLNEYVESIDDDLAELDGIETDAAPAPSREPSMMNSEEASHKRKRPHHHPEHHDKNRRPRPGREHKSHHEAHAAEDRDPQ